MESLEEVVYGKLKVLMVEDNPMDAELIEIHLNKKFTDIDTVRVDNIDDLTVHLQTFDPDLILSDYSMPGFSGKEALDICVREKPGCPFIFVSGTIGEERAVESLKNGAVDYVLKSSLGKLPHAAYNAIKIKKDQIEKRQKDIELNKAHAQLNSIFNSTSMCVAFIDMNYNVLAVNSSFLQQFNVNSNDVVENKPIFDYLIIEQDLRQIFENISKTKKPFFEYSTVFELKGTSQTLYFDWGVSSSGRGDTEDGFVITAINSTDRVEAEAERDELLKNLEEKVQVRTKELIELNAELKQKNKDIQASLRYARYIQEAFIPALQAEKINVSNGFVINLPKDFLSGDFHWQKYLESINKTYVAVGDCTGHGVPGSLMTMLAIQCFEKEIVEVNEPKSVDQILQSINSSIIKFLGQGKEGNIVEDGMEVAILCIDHDLNQLTLSSAGLPVYLLTDTLERIEPSKHFVGGLGIERITKQFKLVKCKFKKGDKIYVCSDGYTDQFGGENNKKFGSKRTLSLLEKIKDLEISEQEKNILNTFQAWKGNKEQTDDVIFVGLEL